MSGKLLIYDIGAHLGEDTAYYLQKGLAVVAVEALPAHVEKMQKLFSRELASGDLIIEQVAIGTETRKGSFLVHSEVSEWNRENFDPNHPSANSGEFRKVDVNFVQPSEIFSKYQIPHYIKVDIEGNDWIVIKSISKDFAPNFVSFEEVVQYRELIEHLFDCGYCSFQIVDQSKHRSMRERRPSLEENSADIRFQCGMTGPFGMDLPNKWIDYHSMLKAIPGLDYNKHQWYDFHASLYPNRFGCLRPPS